MNWLLLLLLYGDKSTFDPTISLGNIITIILVSAGVVAAWTTSKNRIGTIEGWIIERKKYDNEYKETLVELRIAMGSLTTAINNQTSRLNRVEDKVDGVKDTVTGVKETVTEQRNRRREGDGE